MMDGRVLPGSKEHQLPGSKVKKNIFYKNIKISIFTPKEGPTVYDYVLPRSKVKKTFFCVLVLGLKVKGHYYR
jgi:hypothetical protein